MKKGILLSGILVALLLTGCATMAGWVGIASEKSVDEKVSSSSNELESEIQRLQGELEAYRSKVAELEQLYTSMEQAIRATEELQRLAGVMEERLRQLPRDTIEQLVLILQRYLQQSE